MNLADAAGWIAPIATMIAAMMTAANLGSRVTGWGFVVFTIGAIAWCTVAIASGQQNLLWSNAFLLVVDIVGIWRWLGRQARYDDGGQAAASRSSAARVPTLFAVGSIAGAALKGRDGERIGQVIDGMMRCEGSALAYVVVSEGGVSGIGERLHALDPADLRFSEEAVSCDLTIEDLRARPVLDPQSWPVSLAAA